MKYMIPLLCLLAGCDSFTEYAKTMNWRTYEIAQKGDPDWVYFASVEKIDSAQVIRKFTDEIGGLDGTLYVWPDSIGAPDTPTKTDAHLVAEQNNYIVAAKKVGDKITYYVNAIP